MSNHKVASFKVERRAIAVAVFIGEQLDYTQVHQLSSLHTKAEESAVGFVNWIVEAFQIQSAALETIMPDRPIRRAQLTRLAIKTLREHSVSIWEIGKQELFKAYGIPPLRSRRELREIVVSMWPILESHNSDLQVMDAVALGLFVQIERLFPH